MSLPLGRDRYAMVIHHDGGCVDGKNKPKNDKGCAALAPDLDAKAGWGYQLVKIRREYRSLLATRAVAIGANEIAVTFTPSCLK